MKYITVGRVVATHGIRGAVKFKYYNEDKEAFLQYRRLYAESGGETLELKPFWAQPQKGFFLVRFEGFEGPEQVAFLIGNELLVREDDLPPPGEDEYYDFQLIGLEVVNERGEPVGKVVEVIHTGANDVIAVEGLHPLLVPLVEGYVLDVDLGRGIMRIRQEALDA